MSIYKIPITTAFVFFPIIAFFFTLPYLIYQYRKYGAIPFFRSVIVYSFILYLLCTYFLVILPLPSIKEVSNLTTPTTQLIPFEFIKQLSKLSMDWSSLASYLKLIQNKVFYIAAFNILLTVPFGIYLRYYFECKWYKVLIYSFLLSLFFEITQLTGLYGIYPRAYRLFDVDDLILNTLGAMLGFLITPLFSIILPTRKELDEKSFQKGKKVTIFRRALSFCIDCFFLAIMIITMSIALHNTLLEEYTLLISILLYYIVIPLLTAGKTFGKMILKLQVVAKKQKESKNNLKETNEPRYKTLKVELRYLLSYILFYYQFIIINILEKISTNNNTIKIIINSSIWILRIYFWINILNIIINICRRKKEFLYEKITKTTTISTIEYEIIEEKEDISQKKKKEDKNVRVKKDNEKL